MIIKKEENGFVFLLLAFSDPPRPPQKRCQSSKINSAVAKKSVYTIVA
jgi:hypothetical protein